VVEKFYAQEQNHAIDDSISDKNRRRELSSEICVNKKKYDIYSQKAALLTLFGEFGLQIPGANLYPQDECTWQGIHCENNLVTRVHFGEKKMKPEIFLHNLFYPNFQIKFLSKRQFQHIRDNTNRDKSSHQLTVS